MFRSQSITSEAESVASEQTTGKEDREREVPLTPASSMFPPPSIDKPSSRQSSFSGSNAPRSPVPHGRYGRSPSPMLPLPAIRAPSPTASPGAARHAAVGGQVVCLRRLGFSPDGGLLMTPAGQFEDPSVVVGKIGNGKDDVGGTPVRGRGRSFVSASESTPSGSAAGPVVSSSSLSSPSTSSVYIPLAPTLLAPLLRNSQDAGRRAWLSNFRRFCTSSGLALRVLLLPYLVGRQLSRLTLTSRSLLLLPVWRRAGMARWRPVFLGLLSLVVSTRSSRRTSASTPEP